MLIPLDIICASLGVMFICMAIVCLMKRRLLLADKHLWTIALAELYFLLLCSTVFCRSVSKAARLELMPFWSYQAYLNGRDYILGQIVMNVLVFVFIGFLLGGILHGRGWWKALLIGLGMSLMIEVLQYVLKCGISEVDDLIHNGLGVMIGWGEYCLLHRIIGRRGFEKVP